MTYHGEGLLTNRALVSLGALLGVAVPDFWQSKFFVKFVFLLLFQFVQVNFDSRKKLNVRSSVVATELQRFVITLSLCLFHSEGAKTKIFIQLFVIQGLLLCKYWGGWSRVDNFRRSTTVHEPIPLSNRHFWLSHFSDLGN